MLALQTVRRGDARQSAPEQKISNSADFAAAVRSETDDLTFRQFAVCYACGRDLVNARSLHDGRVQGALILSSKGEH